MDLAVFRSVREAERRSLGLIESLRDALYGYRGGAGATGADVFNGAAGAPVAGAADV
jgi:hypothetical protein